MKRLKTAAIAGGLALMSWSGGAQAQDTCDRQCLTDLMDTYIAALVAHDPDQAPLADGIVTVENIQRIAPGEGLWQTASAGPTRFKIYVPDAVAQQVGGMVMIEEEGKPLLLGLRLKLDDGEIVEAEHMLARNLRETALPNLEKPRPPLLQEVPGPYRDSRSRLLYIAKSYYDALDLNNGSLAPFADDCVRHENGIQTARNAVNREGGFGLIGALGCEAQLDTQLFTYIDTIDNRRVEIADEATGLAIGFSHFHHSMARHEFRIIGVPGQETRTLDNDPFDLPAIHIYKVWGGQIHEIEAMGFVTDYMSPTGWEEE